MSIKNKVKLIFPNATNIYTDEYGYTDFKVPTIKDMSFRIWKDGQLFFVYTELIDKLKPSYAHYICDINNKKEVRQFIKDVKWCRARPIKSRDEYIKMEHMGDSYVEYHQNERIDLMERMFAFRYKADMFRDKYGHLTLQTVNGVRVGWGSCCIEEGVLKILVDKDIPTDITEHMYEYADSIDLKLVIYENVNISININYN